MPSQEFLVGVVLTGALLLGRMLTARLRVPDAAAYVVLGVGAGLVPGMPQLRLSPDLVLLVFLPPLIYFAAFFSDPRETVRHVTAVVGQSVGLVLATAAAAAAALLLVFPDIGWAAAIAFGAAIAPPDPVAASTVLQKLGAPRRLVTVLESEGLVNDGIALTVFAVALGAVARTTSVLHIGRELAIQVGGGIGFGLIVGICVTWLRQRTRDAPSQIVLSLASPYLAFVPAQLAQSSGVLATGAAAVWLSTRGRGLVAPTSRLETETFWRVLNLVLVALLFVLLGMQVPMVIAAIGTYPITSLLLAAAAVVATTIAIRMIWVLLAASLAKRLPRLGDPASRMPIRERIALGWCGPRGAVSLAVVLSIPLHTSAGAPFPRRDLLLFLTVVVVLVTLVGQVMTLPFLLRRLRLTQGEQEHTEGIKARCAAVDAALRALDTDSDGRDEEAGNSTENRNDERSAQALRQVLQLRRNRLHNQLEPESDTRLAKEPQPDERELQLWLLGIERHTIRQLHASGQITRTTMIEISQELDLHETHIRTRR